ncbi:unnamed protein product [Discosporangium mesarthrocarpum]
MRTVLDGASVHAAMEFAKMNQWVRQSAEEKVSGKGKGEKGCNSDDMRSMLERAMIYRRRMERVLDQQEEEMSMALSRMMRMEAQYQAMLRHAESKDITPRVALERAREEFLAALVKGEIQEGGGSGELEKGSMDAIEHFSEAIRYLEVHVLEGFKGEEEGDMKFSRELLAAALCNRSLANCRLGNVYNSKVDLGRAKVLCPCSDATLNLIKLLNTHLEAALGLPKRLHEYAKCFMGMQDSNESR